MITAGQAEVLGKVVRQFPEKVDAFDLSPAEKATLRAALARPNAPTPKLPNRPGDVHDRRRLPARPALGRPVRAQPVQGPAGNQAVQLADEAGEALFSQFAGVARARRDGRPRPLPAERELRGVVEGIEAWAWSNTRH